MSPGHTHRMELTTDEAGRPRCGWGAEPEIYRHYHDTEWGFPTTDDALLFEKLCLEGFQAGLSWLTILRKRPDFRRVFANFDPVVVAEFDDDDVARLLADATIVRHQGKIRSTINNAARALEMIDEYGSLAAFFWPLAEPSRVPPAQVPPTTALSTDTAKILRKRGWTFVGPTTLYAFMQAMGLVNDHLDGCWVRESCERSRRRVIGTVAAASV